MGTPQFNRAIGRRAPYGAVACLLFFCALTLPAVGSAQEVADARDGGARLHGIVGAFGGQLDINGGPRLDVLGGRLGLGFGELVQVTGFYWNQVDLSERSFLDDRAWGGEAQLNLNAGFGVTPFVTAGLARVRADVMEGQTEEQTAAIVGAGLQVPIGPVALHASARDYIFGVSGLGDTADDRGTTHNWLLSVGVTTALGRRSAARRPVATVPAAPTEPTVAGVIPDTVLTPADAPEQPGAIRNFQSDQRIEVPLPLEGSITIRYGPEPATPGAQTPIIINPPAAAAPAQPGQTPQAAAQGTGDLAVDRIVERTVAALLPRMESAEARRHDQLRADLNRALTAQESLIRQLVRAEIAALGPLPPAPSPFRDPAVAAAPRDPPPATPRDASPDPLAAAIAATTARLEAVRAETARIEAERAAADVLAPDRPAATAQPEGTVRQAFAGLAARHGTLLSTAETERGPALVVADRAFSTGAALVSDAARPAIQEVAAILDDAPDALIFVHGHTDSVGDEASNQRLSELRAETVRALLVQAGIEPDRLHAVGFGEGRPIAPNTTPEGRALNRRVEIVVSGWSVGSYGGTP